MARIRNALARATHDFFQSHGFLYVHTPIVTTSDCEGAGEMFQVRGAGSADLCTVDRQCAIEVKQANKYLHRLYIGDWEAPLTGAQ